MSAQRSSALLEIEGSWLVHVTPVVLGEHVSFRWGGFSARATFQTSPDAVITGTYLLGPESEPEGAGFKWQLLLRAETSGEISLGFSSETPLQRVKHATRTDRGLCLVAEFDDACTLWHAVAACRPKISGRPTLISIIIRQLSKSSWLLDLGFTIPGDKLADGSSKNLFCRIEHLHTRSPATSSTARTRDFATFLTDIEHRIDNVKQDIEFEIGEFDDLIASFEGGRIRVAEQETAISQLVNDFKDLKDDAEDATDGLSDALLQLHREITSSESINVTSGTGTDPVGEAWSALLRAEDEAESLSEDIDDIDVEVDGRAEELLEMCWTNAGHSRAQRFLRTLKERAAEVDLSFLGPVQGLADRLSKDAIRMVRTSAFLFHLVESDEFLGELDYGAVIASMAKCCERIFADAFYERKEMVKADRTVQLMCENQKRWKFEPLDSIDSNRSFKRVVDILKKGEPFKWSGLNNCVTALLLFGGRVVVFNGGTRRSLNPLGVTLENELARSLPAKLIAFQEHRNGFIHHDLATKDDVILVWGCFGDCLRGLLQVFYFRT